jgi:hypothetical protein
VQVNPPWPQLAAAFDPTASKLYAIGGFNSTAGALMI